MIDGTVIKYILNKNDGKVVTMREGYVDDIKIEARKAGYLFVKKEINIDANNSYHPKTIELYFTKGSVNNENRQ